MKFTLSIYICLSLIVGCSINTQEGNLHLVEAQVLCVYWSPNYFERDTLPAIILILEGDESFTFEDEFLLKVPSESDSLSFQMEVANSLKRNSKRIIALVLKSEQLYPYFEDSQYVEGGACFTESLAGFVTNGSVEYVNSLGTRKKIPKSDDFFLVKGLKGR